MKDLILILLVTPHLSAGCNMWNTQCTTALANRVAPSVIKCAEEVVDSGIDPIRCNSIQLHEEGINLVTKQVKIFGLSNYVVDLLSFDKLANNMSRTIFHTDFYITGHYNCNGTAFSLPVYGDGVFRVLLKNTEFEITAQMEKIVGSDDLIHDSIKNYQFRYDVKDNADIQFENLFYGDKESSDRIHYIFNTHWKLVTEVYSKKYMHLIADTFVQALRVYLKETPLSKFFSL